MKLRLPFVLVGLALCIIATRATAEQQMVAAPPGAKLLLETAAQGVQIYACQQGGWKFSAPEAALFDAAGRQVGIHFAGPSWQAEDGSKIVGEVEAQAPAPEPHAVAWLLLRVKSHEGQGILTGVDLVRRIDTQGGTAPAGACNSDQGSTQARIRYTARYLFYVTPP